MFEDVTNEYKYIGPLIRLYIAEGDTFCAVAHRRYSHKTKDWSGLVHLNVMKLPEEGTMYAELAGRRIIINAKMFKFLNDGPDRSGKEIDEVLLSLVTEHDAGNLRG